MTIFIILIVIGIIGIFISGSPAAMVLEEDMGTDHLELEDLDHQEDLWDQVDLEITEEVQEDMAVREDQVEELEVQVMVQADIIDK